MAKIKTVRVVEIKYKTYALHFTNNLGKRRRFSVGLNKGNAEKLKIKFENFLLDGKDPEEEILKQEQKKKIQLGHKDRATTDRYTTLAPLTAGKLLERLPTIREGDVARIGKVNA